jgi:NADPH:quinone reductase
MRAVAYRKQLPITESDALLDIELPMPEPQGRDLLVQVEAISVNPVDTKQRRGSHMESRGSGDAEPPPKVLGWDAAGTVVATGPEASLFRPGDQVFYAGAIDRPGSNAQFQLVDERIVGPKPKTLGYAEAAAMPLTAITAWEALFDRLDIRRPVPGAANAILIIGGAGGVGSIAVQLVRQLTDVTVIATASRPETAEWAKALGAHHVIDHSKPLAAEVETLGLAAPAFVLSLTHTADHLPEIVQLIAPQGRFALIDDPKTLDVVPFKRKAVSTHWELMFTRSLFRTADMQAQHDLLSEVSRLVDAGMLRTTLNEVLRPISAETLKRAHALVESGRAKGKVVLEGW